MADALGSALGEGAKALERSQRHTEADLLWRLSTGLTRLKETTGRPISCRLGWTAIGWPILTHMGMPLNYACRRKSPDPASVGDIYWLLLCMAFSKALFMGF